MMTLAIDAVGAKEGGAATVLLSVVEQALAGRFANVIVFGTPRPQRHFTLPRSKKLRFIPVQDQGIAHRLCWHWFGLPRAVRTAGATALLCLSGGGRGGGRVYTGALVHQTLPYVPEALATFGLPFRLRMRAVALNTRLCCSRADVVFAQTLTMRSILARHGIDPSKIVVAPPPPPTQMHYGRIPGGSAVVKMEVVPPDRRILYVGSTLPHKNVRVLLRAADILRQVLPDAVLFGTFPKSACGARPNVVPLGYLAPAEVVAAYTAATVVVLPSLAETVGLPLLEAASVGAPVIVADRPYAREVLANRGVYLDPHDAALWANTITRVLTNHQFAARLRAEMRVIGRPDGRESRNGYQAIVSHLLAGAEQRASFVDNRGASDRGSA